MDVTQAEPLSFLMRRLAISTLLRSRACSAKRAAERWFLARRRARAVLRRREAAACAQHQLQYCPASFARAHRKKSASGEALFNETRLN
jgi:hypothetical protein